MEYRISCILIACLISFGCSTSKPAKEVSGAVPAKRKPEQNASTKSPSGPAYINIIPKPHAVQDVAGDGFVINSATEIRYEAARDGFKESAEQLSRALQKQTGLTLRLQPVGEGPQSNKIILTSAAGDDIHGEGYALNADTDRITIRAATPGGVFYGGQSLRQLIPPGVNKNADSDRWTVPAVTIKDRPRFSWRGMHIDVARHFFSEDTIREFIDYLAYYKFNKLHMHLTDDQGWRLQIKQYPKLTKEGAWRTFNSQDSTAIENAKTNSDFALPKKHMRVQNGQKEYGGFYTQKQMKRMIDYADERHITIVPEIDMPGHLMSAIQSYPELSCTGKADWGSTFSVPACPCKESTFTFLENVLDEVAALFPGEYIHIGADEVEKTTWRQSDDCQQLMKEEQLDSAEQIQSYFVNRMARYLQSKGKKVIGWDEIVEGGIPDDVTMMYWRSWAADAPRIAAENGNDIIMAPNSCCYFSVEQTPESLRNVYRFDPVPDSFTGDQGSFILGAEGALWTEWIPSRDRLYYMAMPRMLAMSEVVWSSEQGRDWADFSRRIQPHYTRLDMDKINYRQPDLKGFHPRNAFINSIRVSFNMPREDISLYYTTDGSEPTRDSKEYSAPFTLRETTDMRLKTFLPTGAAGETYETSYVQQDPKPGVSLANPAQGLRLQYTDKAYHTVDDFNFDTDSSVRRMTADSFEVPEQIAQKPTFGIVYSGYIKIPTEGVYTFYTSSDDGSTLYVADQLAVDNDEPHSEIEKTTRQVALKAGFHPIELRFFELGGGHALHVLYEGPGISKQAIPANQLFYQK